MRFIDNKDNCHVWVLAPFLESEDENLNYYLDYTQSIAEYTKAFAEIGCTWTWMNVTTENIQTVIDTIKQQTIKQNIVLNLCDGDDINGTPGVSIIHALNKHALVYTGSNVFFYDITTSKIPMKTAFDAYNVPTPAWKVIKNDADIKGVFNEIGDLLIVKPAISAGSMGLTVKNVVDTEGAFLSVVEDMKKGYRGWQLDADGIFVEAFITGREFTTFVIGSHSDPDTLIVYPPIERIFHHSLPDKERFLSFDRLWETYDEETAMPNDDFFYTYAQLESKALIDELKALTIKAYQSVGGSGYGRLDVRMDNTTNKLYVLEINAQCGISEDEDFTSIGAILRFNKTSFAQLVIQIIQDALNRHLN